MSLNLLDGVQRQRKRSVQIQRGTTTSENARWLLITARCGCRWWTTSRPTVLAEICTAVERLLTHHESLCKRMMDR